MIKFENATKGLCVIDDRPVRGPHGFVCLSCRRACEVIQPLRLQGSKEELKIFLFDAKSKCCNADVQNVGTITCSTRCHDIFVKEMEKEFGTIKKVVDQNTGRAYAVPTKDIIEMGLNYEDLCRYPPWEGTGVT